jgi:hypothetical protein
LHIFFWVLPDLMPMRGLPVGAKLLDAAVMTHDNRTAISKPAASGVAA